MNSLLPLSVLAIALSADCAASEPSWIDQFVAGRQQEAGVTRQPEADRATLLRRVSFDLIGLPPTPEEVDKFVADRSPHAYEKQVERLLASPRYGEHWATWWLDLARYADSDGYHDDTNRSMWPYRDYVINAFNENKPFDEFTIEQLAGDLLPNPTLEQLVATAFHRNAPTSSEDGANPEEYRARYAADRVNTTSQVWLGLTVQCAECHDHKYDAITTKEYYELFAFFNQTPEEPLFRGLHAPPSIAVPSSRQEEQLEVLDQRLATAKKQFESAAEHCDREFNEWLVSRGDTDAIDFPREAIVCEFTFEEEATVNTGARRRAAKLVNRGPNAGNLANSPMGRSLQFTGDEHLDLGQLFEVRQSLSFTLETWLKPKKQGGAVFSKIDEQNDSRGFEVRIEEEGRVVVRLVEKWPDAAIQVGTVGSLDANDWQHLSVTFDGRVAPDGIHIYINGKAQDLSIDVAKQTERIRNRAPFLIGGGLKSKFHGELDDVRFYKWALPHQQLERLPIRKVRQVDADSGRGVLRHFYVNAEHKPSVEALRQVELIQRELRLHQQQLPRVRVMRDVETPRETYVLVRGDFRSRGERVEPSTPSLLPAMSAKRKLARKSRHSRLGLAHWLVNENREQTAMVLTNRLWAQFFSRGIIPTLDDFGVSGESATHPELLKRLRDELIRRGWDIKSLIREIVTSVTYRQSSRAGPENYSRDPNNELLARGPRHRLSAEAIRDNALAISGLLANRVGGPSVRPYQPKGLWREMSKGDELTKQYEPSQGESLYRRGLYTFWKRSIHYPTFDVLDAPSREVCKSSRPTTNTATQALTLLNDPTFVETARVFATKIVQHSDEFEQRIRFAFRQALGRNANEREIEVLRKTRDSIQAESRSTEVTWTALAQMILTLDETISKE